MIIHSIVITDTSTTKMQAKYNLVCILIILCIKYSVYASESDYITSEDVHEGSSCEEKISAELSVMKTETNRKLDDMEKLIRQMHKMQMDTLEKMLPERLEKYIDNNFSILETKNLKTQENMSEKFHKLEKNLVDKLEEYIIEKLNSLEKHVNRKIDTLENSIPDKADANITIRKLDLLKKMQLDSDGGAICKMANKTSKFIEEDINTKLYTIEKTILDLENTTTNLNLDALENNLTNLADNLNQKLTELKKTVGPDMKENISRKLDSLGNKILEYLYQNVTLKLETIEKKIINLDETIQYKLGTSNTIFEQTIDRKLDEIQKKIPQLEHNMNDRMTALQNLEKNVLTEVSQTQYTLGCKEQRVKKSNYYIACFRMDNETLKHVTYSKYSAGSTTFEMHLAVNGKKDALIMLSTTATSNEETYFDIVIGITSKVLGLYWKGKKIKSVPAPFKMSPNQFTPIYIKVNDGTLEIGQEGSGSPFISYSDVMFKSVKYYSFASVHEEKIFLYDCPSTVLQLSI